MTFANLDIDITLYGKICYYLDKAIIIMSIVDINYVTQDKHVCKRTPSSLGSTLEMWPCASVVSLCVCTERETQGARGLGVGPWGAH